MERAPCPKCGKVSTAKKNRCYTCFGKRRTGETRNCKVCGKEFHAAKWQLEALNNQGVYCSRACKHRSFEIDGPGCHRTRGDGYIDTYYPKHPDTSVSGWMLEHRLVAEKKIGRRLLKTEHVHHINAIRDDNRPENLEVIDAGVHASISTARGVQLRKEMREKVIQLTATVSHLEGQLMEYERRFGPL